mmetsp:Transcript_70965/g.179611  ORF Transcript_70965/g.179611 Transcript_70965/m.179611 type:complete len:204 (-) Transcript_70965:557-1168(-)
MATELLNKQFNLRTFCAFASAADHDALHRHLALDVLKVRRRGALGIEHALDPVRAADDAEEHGPALPQRAVLVLRHIGHAEAHHTRRDREAEYLQPDDRLQQSAVLVGGELEHVAVAQESDRLQHHDGIDGLPKGPPVGHVDRQHQGLLLLVPSAVLEAHEIVVQGVVPHVEDAPQLLGDLRLRPHVSGPHVGGLVVRLLLQA